MAKPRGRTNDFVSWIESTIHLPLGLSAEPGQITLPVYLRDIAAAMADPAVEKITIQKSARIGFSTLLSSLIAYHFVEHPAPVLLVLPAEADARNAVVALEEIFDTSPRLKGRLPNPSLGRSDRNTILYRRGAGGASLRCVGANAPRNLRAIAAQLVAIDEGDALQDTEGDVIALAEARSLTFKKRLVIVGGTPLLAETSRVARSFTESDQRIYECRCPLCRGYAELRWPQFEWEPGRSDTVRWRCPHCQGAIEERHKPQMVREGRWRALRPEAVGPVAIACRL
jgi:phage terminase large subunit GpA-like protein